ncbi:hypothetical protein [Candidatus Protochlamydia naegleriophila]|uniref:hypothetical protein n=1 Tax=Candidatus Protochlamydia naegleriophila TaxID=389348 RepID=UPI000A7CB7F7|nr:hypothetical protein [Candidatus Protochlamydia naegleriophila]
MERINQQIGFAEEQLLGAQKQLEEIALLTKASKDGDKKYVKNLLELIAKQLQI